MPHVICPNEKASKMSNKPSIELFSGCLCENCVHGSELGMLARNSCEIWSNFGVLAVLQRLCCFGFFWEWAACAMRRHPCGAIHSIGENGIRSVICMRSPFVALPGVSWSRVYNWKHGSFRIISIKWACLSQVCIWTEDGHRTVRTQHSVRTRTLARSSLSSSVETAGDRVGRADIRSTREIRIT
jgi:hypothetical protein